jgi:hypothetical protein
VIGDDTLSADLAATATAVESGWPIAKLHEKKRRDRKRGEPTSMGPPSDEDVYRVIAKWRAKNKTKTTATQRAANLAGLLDDDAI